MQFWWECLKRATYKTSLVNNSRWIYLWAIFITCYCKQCGKWLNMDVLVGGGFWHAACHQLIALLDKVPASKLNCLPKRRISSNEFLHCLQSFVTEWHSISQEGDWIIEILETLADWTLYCVLRVLCFLPWELNVILTDNVQILLEVS